jgi:hypothetical protein
MRFDEMNSPMNFPGERDIVPTAEGWQEQASAWQNLQGKVL